MPDHDELEERLRRAFQWVAGNTSDNSDSQLIPIGARPVPVEVEGDDDGAFLDDDTSPRTRRSGRRPVVLVAAAVLLLGAIGVTVGFVVAGTGTPSSVSHQPSNKSAAAARARVISALGATTAAGNWNIAYSYTEVPGQETTTTTTVPSTVPCASSVPPAQDVTGSGCAVLILPGGSSEDNQNVTVTGTGVIDVNPKAMVTEADPSDFGPVVVRLDSTQLWELGSDDGGGLAPATNDGSTAGQAISQFAGLVESTLGTREGAVAMLGIASPTGYLVLDEQEITGVTPTGQGTVNGTPVTEYRVAADPSQLESDPSASSEELTTMRAAINTLQAQGLSSTSTDVAVDAQGFIVQSSTTYDFSDGGSVTVLADFSNFGCAGTVLMPGQVGPTTPPAGCVSPDSPSSTTTTSSSSTTTSSSSSTTSTSLPVTTTTTSNTTPTTIPPTRGSSTTSPTYVGSTTTTTTTGP
jgi:hypothetical protein